MRLILPVFLILSIVLFACQPFKSDALIRASETGSLAAKEFEDLQLNMGMGWLGSFSRQSPSAAFMNEETTKSLIEEMKKAIAGKSSSLRFLGCQARSVFPDTMDAKECAYVLDSVESTLEFRFNSFSGSKSCLLGSPGCKIHQVVSVLAKNNGIQRPPRFAFKDPVDSKILLLTNRIFYSNKPSIQNFLRRWTESNEFAALVVDPYNFPKVYGEELAGMLGQCGKQFMNIVHLSNAALQRYNDRKKPVVLSGIVAQSGFMAISIMAGVRSFFLAPQAATLLKGSSIWKGSIMALDIVGDVTALPWVVTELANLENHINQYPVGSAQRRAIQTALFLSSLGDWAGFSEIGAISVKHWKSTAKVLGVLAVGGAAGTFALREKHVAQLAESLQHGNITEVRSRLCNMQKEAGLRKHCELPQKPTVCK